MKIIDQALLWYSVNYHRIGFYPMQYRVNEEYVPRSPWQEGWNACNTSLSYKMKLVEDWFEKLKEDQRETLLNLIKNGTLNVGVEGYENEKETQENTKVTLEIRCGDSFVYACSDSEEVELDEIPFLLECLEDYPEWGGLRFICIKRKEKPLIELIEMMQETDAWDEVMEALPPNICNIDIPRW